NPVVVRAVDPDAFLRLENATHLSGAMAGSEFALAGEHLALRFGLATGDTVTVAGAYVPRIAFLGITGTFRTESAANDEILVDFGVHAVQARAFADRVPAVGVLRAVGASNGWMRRRLLLETLPFSLLAGVVGALIGFFAGKFLEPRVNVVVFGHQVPIVFDFVTLAFIVLLLVAVSITSALVLLRGTLRLRPTASIRETVAVEPPRSLE